jgi:hypothetical protein
MPPVWADGARWICAPGESVVINTIGGRMINRLPALQAGALRLPVRGALNAMATTT